MEIEFVSAYVLKKEKDKIEFILQNIKKEKIIVLDYLLSPEEERKLIEETMKRINSKFSGIEISTLKSRSNNPYWKQKILEILGEKSSGMTIIGPSSIVKSIKKNPDAVRVLLGESDAHLY